MFSRKLVIRVIFPVILFLSAVFLLGSLIANQFDTIRETPFRVIYFILVPARFFFSSTMLVKSRSVATWR